MTYWKRIWKEVPFIYHLLTFIMIVRSPVVVFYGDSILLHLLMLLYLFSFYDTIIWRKKIDRPYTQHELLNSRADLWQAVKQEFLSYRLVILGYFVVLYLIFKSPVFVIAALLLYSIYTLLVPLLNRAAAKSPKARESVIQEMGLITVLFFTGLVFRYSLYQYEWTQPVVEVLSVPLGWKMVAVLLGLAGATVGSLFLLPRVVQ